MTDVWESCFEGVPGTLNRKLLDATDDKSLAVWRGICRASHTGGKADFAHRLAERLETAGSEFAVPNYLRRAISTMWCREWRGSRLASKQTFSRMARGSGWSRLLRAAGRRGFSPRRFAGTCKVGAA